MNLNLRPAAISDLLLVFAWSNDPITRQNSFSQKPITIEEHTAWFKRLLENPNRKLYILLSDNKPAGQIRLDFNEDKTSAEISYSIAPDFRGQGLGSKIIKLAIKKVKSDFKNVQYLTAQVKPENTASNKIFSKLGFEEKCIMYEYKLDKTNGGGIE